jgi:hypothetical protein
MTPTDKMEMQVAEEQDGSAVVQLPDDEVSPQALEKAPDDDNQQDLAAGGSVDDDANDGLDSDPDREAIRAARREERKLKKNLHREKARESNHLINALRKQNADLAERLSRVERTTSGAEMARVDKAIDDEAVRVEYAKMKMQEAIAAGDGQAATRAQEAWYEAQRKVESLQALKANATRQQQQQPTKPAPQDPNVVRMAKDWMERNRWYRPDDPDNIETSITQRIDAALTNEGFDPASEDYWDELDNRLKKYVPQRYTDENDRESPRSQRPRSIVTSSGRESAATPRGNQFILSPERVSAIKEAGKWQNIESRNKMIRKYAEYDRQNKGR